VLSRSLQESLAHAKVSARQQCVYDGLKPLASEEICDKSTQGTRGLQLCRYIIRLCCCLPNLQNPAKFYENSNL